MNIVYKEYKTFRIREKLSSNGEWGVIIFQFQRS